MGGRHSNETNAQGLAFRVWVLGFRLWGPGYPRPETLLELPGNLEVNQEGRRLTFTQGFWL